MNTWMWLILLLFDDSVSATGSYFYVGVPWATDIQLATRGNQVSQRLRSSFRHEGSAVT
jgi:hypothetical protein